MSMSGIVRRRNRSFHGMGGVSSALPRSSRLSASSSESVLRSDKRSIPSTIRDRSPRAYCVPADGGADDEGKDEDADVGDTSTELPASWEA